MSEPDWKRRHEALWDAADQHALALEYLNPGAPKSYLRGSKGRSFVATSALITPNTWVGEDERLLVEGGRRVYRYYILSWREYEGGGGDWVKHEAFAELERPNEKTSEQAT